MELTELIKAGGTNAYGPPGATYRQPKYGDALFPTLDNTYEGFFVDLAPDEAILLRGRLPRARYTSLVFYDRWWATPDYPRVRCYLTDRDLVLNADGSYDAVIAAADPGAPNWIDTGGLTQGIFASRFLLTEEKLLPEASVVKLADAAGAAPPGRQLTVAPSGRGRAAGCARRPAAPHPTCRRFRRQAPPSATRPRRAS